MSETNTAVLGASTIALPIATGYFGNVAIWVMLGIFALIVAYNVVIKIIVKKI